MRVLSIDVGTGTQDILLYDTEREIENSLVMIMPSPTVIVAEKIGKATQNGQNIVLTGDVMGGGPCVRAIKAHMEKGLKVYATEKAALTIKDDIERVRSMGIDIISDDEVTNLSNVSEEIVLQDIDVDALSNALASFGVDMPEMIAVAVQDHGNSPQESNRIYRFRIFEGLIDKGGSFEQFAYSAYAVPEEFTRMAAVARTLKKQDFIKDTIIMDTGPAAIFGALLDENALQPAVVVNIGNGHTLAAIVKDNHVVALFEHHSSALDGEKLQKYIMDFASGKLGFKDIFDDGGHGCYIRETPGSDAIRSIMITGPRRNILMDMAEEKKDSSVWDKLYFASPYGNMMLSGCFGLLTVQLDKEL
ncbi:Uncharacterized protein, DUF1786 family [Methanolobus vulcani]|uniref:Uncharacterized protein, DUF1786 family n=1 Tax=Methanolobus vulcani TaxID=38026 RepID=A0A7Z7AV34_9EURY|nr:DUF1786 family protein [Methanolobus vulcani]SDF50196.1 Uncharacterized protein, DUF1786 family [Methanolobus vulcani]